MLTGAAIKACGPGCGDEGVGATFQPRVDVEHVAADHAAGRVHQHVMANGVAFGIEALQHAQRAVVAVVGDGALARVGGVAPRVPIVKIKLAVPCHGRCRRAARELKQDRKCIDAVLIPNGVFSAHEVQRNHFRGQVAAVHFFLAVAAQQLEQALANHHAGAVAVH